MRDPTGAGRDGDAVDPRPTTTVTVIPGDGVGPEIVAAARTVIDATGVGPRWEVRPAGVAAHAESGEALPAETIASIRRNGLALKGPLGSPAGAAGSLNGKLRAELDLYASLRPCRTLNPRSGRADCDLLIVRENHEDVFAGIDFMRDQAEAEALRVLVRETHGRDLAVDAGVSLRPISARGSARAMRLAFERAADTGHRRLAVGHKANVMPASDSVFLQAARDLAGEFPQIEYEEVLIDTLCGRLVANPSRYEVVALPNLFGDIVSDIGAALVGGTGMAPCANIGPGCALFEAVHGTALRLAGTDAANPTGLILAGALLLRQLGEDRAAGAVEQAVRDALADPCRVTYDQVPSGRPVGTTEFAEALASRVADLRVPASAS